MSRLHKEIWRSYDSNTSLLPKKNNRPLSFATQLMRTYKPSSDEKNVTPLMELKKNKQALMKLFDTPLCLSSVHFNDIKLPEFAACKRIQGKPRQSWILNSTPWILDSRHRIKVSVELGFWIPIVSGMLDSLRRILNPNPKPRIPDSTSKKFTDSGIRIPLHVATECLTNQD